MIKSEDRTFLEGERWSPEQLRAMKIADAAKRHGRRFCPKVKRIAPRSAVLEQLDYVSNFPLQSRTFRPSIVVAT